MNREAESNSTDRTSRKALRDRNEFQGYLVDHEGVVSAGQRSDSGTYSMTDNEHGLYHRRILKAPGFW